jgi:hypothetical protein
MEEAQLVNDEPNFLVDYEAGRAGHFRGKSDALWIRIGQRIRRHNRREMWESIAVEGKHLPDGSLLVRVLVFNPDWDEPLQIASIRSRPSDPECLTALGCNLDHIAV